MPQLESRERVVHVYLPCGYDDAVVDYAVLYLQDGEKLGAWRVSEALDQLSGERCDVIVVGVESGPDRWGEYGPWSNDAMHRWIGTDRSPPRREGGDGDAYVAFVAETLKPAIDASYRTRRDAAHTGIGGSSMGGLIALHAGLARPELFGRVMAMSPAAWFAERGACWMSENRLLDAIRSAAVARDLRVYVDVGTNERSRACEPDVVDDDGHGMTYPSVYVDGLRRIVDALRARGVGDERLRVVIEDGAAHDEAAWARRLPDALRWLYAE